MFEEMNEKIITVAGKKYSENDLLVVIPLRYRETFRHIDFKDMSEFSRGLMYAHCAEEARRYNKSWEVRDNEVSLYWFAKNRAI